MGVIVRLLSLSLSVNELRGSHAVTRVLIGGTKVHLAGGKGDDKSGNLSLGLNSSRLNVISIPLRRIRFVCISTNDASSLFLHAYRRIVVSH